MASILVEKVRVIEPIGRWGGEEFVALLPETSEVEALAVAERIRSAIASHSMSEVPRGLRCFTCEPAFDQHR